MPQPAVNPPPSIQNLGIILVDHGSRRSESNEMLLDVVRNFEAATGYSVVEPAHMELAEPSIDTAFSRCVVRGATTIVVFPYFLLPGRHWYEDIPQLAAAAASKHAGIRYLVTAPFGLHPLMAEVMRQRIDHCIAHTNSEADACELCAGTDRCQFRGGPTRSLDRKGRLGRYNRQTIRHRYALASMLSIGRRDIVAEVAKLQSIAEFLRIQLRDSTEGNTMKRPAHTFVLFLASFALVPVGGRDAIGAAPFVPGSGELLGDCCDNFEDPNWSFRYNHPKSSHEQDKQQRGPGGRSRNGLWHEGGKRGTPDVVKRVETPLGGIPGSNGSLLFATRNSGIPGRVANSQQQDDLLMQFDRRLGRSIPISWQPSCTVRVYLPPFEEWENRTGPQFGMRADCQGRNPDGTTEAYWPGMFLLFQSETSRRVKQDSAEISCRGDRLGHDIRKLDITEPGWWTLGLSFTSDGQVHYYASPGVDDLTADDYIMSSFPYSMKCLTFNNFFFNVANWETGRTWSTNWVIDDPKVFVIPPPGQTAANLYRIKRKPQTARQQQMRNRNARSSTTNPRTASNQRTTSNQRATTSNSRTQTNSRYRQQH